MIAVYVIGMLLVITHSLGLYQNHPEVTKLTDDNFDDLVTDGDEVWLVEFYAPWCGVCQTFSSEYLKAAHELKGKVQVGVVDTTKQSFLVERFAIEGVPTVKIFIPNEESPKEIENRKYESLVEATLKEKQLYEEKHKRSC